MISAVDRPSRRLSQRDASRPHEGTQSGRIDDMREHVAENELRAWREHAATSSIPVAWTTRKQLFERFAAQAKAAVLAGDGSARHPQLGQLKADSSVLPIAGLLYDHSPWLANAGGNRFTGEPYGLDAIALCAGNNRSVRPDPTTLDGVRDVFFDVVLSLAVGIDSIRQQARRKFTLRGQPAIVRKVMDASFDGRGESTIRGALQPALWSRASHDLLEQDFRAALGAFGEVTGLSFELVCREFAENLLTRIKLVAATPDLQSDDAAAKALDTLWKHVRSVSDGAAPRLVPRGRRGLSYTVRKAWDLENEALDPDGESADLDMGAVTAQLVADVTGELMDAEQHATSADLVARALDHLRGAPTVVKGRPSETAALAASATLLHADAFMEGLRLATARDAAELRRQGDEGKLHPWVTSTKDNSWRKFVEDRLVSGSNGDKHWGPVDFEDVLDATVWALAAGAITAYTDLLDPDDTFPTLPATTLPSPVAHDDEGHVS